MICQQATNRFRPSELTKHYLRCPLTTTMKHLELFEPVNLTAKSRVIKAFPKSDIVIIQFDIWDSQNGSKAKLLINYSFNFGRYIATIRATNINPRVPQCYNCQKWGHSTFSYCTCHKLHSAISPSILHQFSQSQWLQKALEKTFQLVPVTPQSDQYWPRYQADQLVTIMVPFIKSPISRKLP